MASYLYRNSPVPTSEKKFTFSTWLKMSDASTSADNGIVEWYKSSSERYQILIDSATRQLRLYAVEAGAVKATIYSNMVFRDTNAWYHIVIHSDTTQSSSSDAFKLWVNGSAQTFSSYTWSYNQNVNVNVFDGSGTKLNLGTRGEAYATWLNGYLADTYYIDGSLIAYTEFGETDSTTGEWKPNTQPTISSFGNAGVHLKYENSGTIGLDSSGNTNNFTASGTVTQTEDCPSNVFATLNPLYQQTTGEGVVLSYGNTKGYYASNSSRSCFGSIAQSSGKYYYECKIPAGTGTVVVGIVDLAWSGLNGAAGAFHDNALNFGYNVSGQKTSGGVNTAYGSAISDNDILGCAMDLDNGKLYFSLNGSWQGSGDPTSGSTGTGSAFNLASGANYTAACRLRNGTICEFNFGNGYFGTTQISSEGTNASGIGKFEYDVPTGFTALSTKGLNL